MSICLAQDTLPLHQQLLALAICLLVAGGIGAAAGVFRKRSVMGPDRFPIDQALWRLALAGVLAASFWLGIQLAYIGVKAAHLMQAHPGQPLNVEEHLSGPDYAVLATVPFIVGFLFMLILDRMLDPRTLSTIGFTWSKLGRGLLWGVLGALITFPLVFGSSLVLEQFYQAIHFEHPTAHQLLAVMKETNQPLVRGALVVGASVLAPFFEEYLFRGHIQTFLASVFSFAERRRMSEPVVVAPPPTFDTVIAYASPPPKPPPPAQRSVRPVWMAILLTSVLFAVIHPLWTSPLIFVLSVCLGYAYERTGNLWVPITIHALFNTMNTVYFLNAA